MFMYGMHACVHNMLGDTHTYVMCVPVLGWLIHVWFSFLWVGIQLSYCKSEDWDQGTGSRPRIIGDHCVLIYISFRFQSCSYIQSLTAAWSSFVEYGAQPVVDAILLTVVVTRLGYGWGLDQWLESGSGLGSGSRSGLWRGCKAVGAMAVVAAL